MSARTWAERFGKACKIGTIPMVVRVNFADWRGIDVGKFVRVQYAENGRWERVLVTRVDPDGYFMANK